MIGKETIYHWSFTMYTGLSLINIGHYTLFLCLVLFLTLIDRGITNGRADEHTILLYKVVRFFLSVASDFDNY